MDRPVSVSAPRTRISFSTQAGSKRGAFGSSVTSTFACDAVAALHYVLGEPVSRLGGEVLHLAPCQLARRAVVALPDHRGLVTRVLVADVGRDVVALGHVPLVLGTELVVLGSGARCHVDLSSVGPDGSYQTGVFDANDHCGAASC